MIIIKTSLTTKRYVYRIYSRVTTAEIRQSLQFQNKNYSGFFSNLKWKREWLFVKVIENVFFFEPLWTFGLIFQNFRTYSFSLFLSFFPTLRSWTLSPIKMLCFVRWLVFVSRPITVHARRESQWPQKEKVQDKKIGSIYIYDDFETKQNLRLAFAELWRIRISKHTHTRLFLIKCIFKRKNLRGFSENSQLFLPWSLYFLG